MYFCDIYVHSRTYFNLPPILCNNGLLLTFTNCILKYYSLQFNSDYEVKSIVRYLWNAPFLPELLILFGDRLKPQYWKMFHAFRKLFLMTRVLNSLCLSDKRTTVVRRDVQCIIQVHPGRPQALVCSSVSALFSPTNADADGCANCSRLLPEPIETWKTKAFRGLVLTTAPKVLLKPHFSLEFPYAEYLSPERNQISFTAKDFSLF